MAQPQNIWVNMLGQEVDISHPDTASGLYVASDVAMGALDISGDNICPQGMRPERMVIKGLEFEGKNYINACGGKISQEDMPDIHVIDWEYRIYIDMVLVLLVIALAGAISIKLLK